MADQKISELPEVTSMADDDWITGVDISDTGTNPTGENVKIQKSNLLGAGGLPAGSVLKTEIARLTNVVAGTFDFAALTLTGYDRVELRGRIKHSAAVNGGDAYVYFNGDETAANYHSQQIAAGSGSSAFPQASTPEFSFDTIPGTSSSANAFGQVKMEFEAPTDTDKLLQAYITTNSLRTASLSAINMCQVGHKTAVGPLTAIKVVGIAGDLTGTLILYGEKTV